MSSDNGLVCFNRIELQKISETFILLDKSENRVNYLEELKRQDFKQIDLLSRKVEILNKDISLCNENTKGLINLNNDLKSNNDKLRLTRNISIGLAGLFGLIAIIK